MVGNDPGSHVFLSVCSEDVDCPGTGERKRRPSFERLCQAMTKNIPCKSEKNPGRAKRPGVCDHDIFLLRSEVIIAAVAHHPEPVTLRHAGDGEAAAGKTYVGIFGLGAPVGCE